jgi:hypothetical protein
MPSSYDQTQAVFEEDMKKNKHDQDSLFKSKKIILRQEMDDRLACARLS